MDTKHADSMPAAFLEIRILSLNPTRYNVFPSLLRILTPGLLAFGLSPSDLILPLPLTEEGASDKNGWRRRFSLDSFWPYLYIAFPHGSLTQSVEYLPFKQRVVGSSPTRPTSSTFGPHRLVRSRTPAFHAGNTGSNPVGDAR